ncbi:hypothetical protein [Viscerimonas tarda]
MEFELTGPDGEPVETSFSLSIKDAGAIVSTIYADNVMTNMLLSSELKGYIEDPAYYFEKDDEKTKSDLDLLVLTQGWRRYVWEEMAGTKEFTLNQPVEKGIVIDGTVKDFMRDRNKDKVDVSIILTKDKQGILHEQATTNQDGKFGVYTQDLWGEWDMALQTKEKDKKKDYRIMLNRLFSPTPLSYMGYETKIKGRVQRKQTLQADETEELDEEIIEIAADTTLLTMSEQEHLLPTVTVKKRKFGEYNDKEEDLSRAEAIYDVRQEIDAMADAGDYLGESVVDFLLKTDKNFSVMYERVNDADISREMGLDITYQKTNYLYLNKSVVFMVNNKPARVSPYSHIRNVPMSEVDTIAITESREITMRNFGRGYSPVPEAGGLPYDVAVAFYKDYLEDELVDRDQAIYSLPEAPEAPEAPDKKILNNSGKMYILVYTYPDDKFRPDKKGIRNTKLQGYSYAKEFYSPQYDYAVSSADKDYRRTIYWNPNVETDKSGKAGVSFYNNSTSRQLLIDAETVTSSGLFGIYEK